jgi:hypothetical protein
LSIIVIVIVVVVVVIIIIIIIIIIITTTTITSTTTTHLVISPCGSPFQKKRMMKPMRKTTKQTKTKISRQKRHFSKHDRFLQHPFSLGGCRGGGLGRGASPFSAASTVVVVVVVDIVIAVLSLAPPPPPSSGGGGG